MTLPNEVTEAWTFRRYTFADREIESIDACVQVAQPSDGDDTAHWEIASAALIRERSNDRDVVTTHLGGELVDAERDRAINRLAHDNIRLGLAAATCVEIAEKIVAYQRNPFLVEGLARLMDVVSRSGEEPGAQSARIEMIVELLFEHLPGGWEPLDRNSDLMRLRNWLKDNAL